MSYFRKITSALLGVLVLLNLLVAAPSYAGPPPLSAAQISASGGVLYNDNKTPSSAIKIFDLSNTTHNELRIIGTNGSGLTYAVTATAGTEFSQTSRHPFTTVGAVTRVAVLLRNGAYSGVSEAAPANDVIETVSLEYGNISVPFTVNGQRTFIIPRTAPYVRTDDLGIFIPATTTAWIREHRRVAKAPPSPAAAVAAGGALTSGTQYYYKFTTVDTGQESYPSSEVSATPSSTNLAIALTWTAPTYGEKIRVYRSTSSGAEKFLAELPATATGWTDTGVLQNVVGASPPSAQLTYQSDGTAMFSGESTNSGGGSQTDVTASTGTITGTGGPAGFAHTIRPLAVLGDDYTSPSMIGIGNSILAGTAITSSYTGGLYEGRLQNWYTSGCAQAGISCLNMGFPSSRFIEMTSGLNDNRARTGVMRFARYIFNQQGRNDLYVSGGITWQSVAAQHLALAKALYGEGRRYFTATIGPTTTSTDGWLTMANQTIDHSSTYDVQRQGFNNWLRNGMLVDGSGNPVLSGGTATPYITGFFDLAALYEADASGALVSNGGYYQVPASPAITGTFTSGSTTSLLQSSTTLTQYQNRMRLLKITSGAASGQVAIISDNAAATITPYASGATINTGIVTNIGLTTAPASGDTYAIYDIKSPDGIHLSASLQATIAAAFATWINAVIKPLYPLAANDNAPDLALVRAA